ncbi:MAG TPA: IclR family transcriptional regulator [Quisquiliibacterium sp.]|nr:IclR family transcriptional regulator [Quisquiliibacterium sp.]
MARAVELLDAIAASADPAGISELARRLRLSKSTVHGLATTLVHCGLLERERDGGLRMGPKSVAWAGAFSERSNLVAEFSEIARDFAPLAEETVMLSVLDGAQVFYLACRNGTKPLAVNFRVGGRFPAWCTSTGKAMMATLPQAQVRATMQAAGMKPLTRHGPASVDALIEQLAQARRRGYAVDDEETAEGMNCFGAPVFAAGSSQAVAAVGVSLIKSTTTARRRAQVIASIRELAQRLSARLGA